MSNRQQRRMQEKSLRKPQGDGQQTLVTPANALSAFQAAVQYHRTSRFREAETLYRQLLALDANHIGSLSGLGMIEFQAGNYHAALA